MWDWGDLSTDARHAAQVLFRAGHPRSCVSRAYFAAYCALVSRLPSGVPLPRGRRNPPHNQLLRLVRHEPAFGPSQSDRRALRTDLHYLRELRNSADYRPGMSLTQAEARNALSVCHAICRRMGCV